MIPQTRIITATDPDRRVTQAKHSQWKDWKRQPMDLPSMNCGGSDAVSNATSRAAAPAACASLTAWSASTLLKEPTGWSATTLTISGPLRMARSAPCTCRRHRRLLRGVPSIAWLRRKDRLVERSDATWADSSQDRSKTPQTGDLFTGTCKPINHHLRNAVISAAQYSRSSGQSQQVPMPRSTQFGSRRP
jgi:hypothetical protein